MISFDHGVRWRIAANPFLKIEAWYNVLLCRLIKCKYMRSVFCQASSLKLAQDKHCFEVTNSIRPKASMCRKIYESCITLLRYEELFIFQPKWMYRMKIINKTNTGKDFRWMAQDDLLPELLLPHASRKYWKD